MGRIFLALAGVAGFLAVAAGAFGAHALANRLSADMLKVFQTGVLYHLVHALALLLVAFFVDKGWPITASGWCFVAGIVLFSGSLYALSLAEVRIPGAAPSGGLAMILAWFLMLLTPLRGGETEPPD